MDGVKTWMSPCGVIMVGVLCLISTQVTESKTYQSTYQDHSDSDHAIDGDVTTCTRTGTDKGPWWMYDMGVSKKLKKIQITGELGEFEVRLGDFFNPYGSHEGFEVNPKCAYFGEQLNTTFEQEIAFGKEMEGRYLTVQTVNPKYRAIKLCEVKLVQ